MATKKGEAQHRATPRRRKRTPEEKARRQVLDDLDDLHEHIQGMEDVLADLGEVQRVTAQGTLAVARAMHALLHFAAVEMPRAAGQPPLPGLVDQMKALEEELEKLKDVQDLMEHLDTYRDEVLKP